MKNFLIGLTLIGIGFGGGWYVSIGYVNAPETPVSDSTSVAPAPVTVQEVSPVVSDTAKQQDTTK